MRCPGHNQNGLTFCVSYCLIKDFLWDGEKVREVEERPQIVFERTKGELPRMTSPYFAVFCVQHFVNLGNYDSIIVQVLYHQVSYT